MSVEINAKMVSDLRAQTGAGLMDCKKALIEAQGSLDEAVTILRKKGMASAAKKAGREASEGLVETYIHTGGKVGVMIELNCETDFVAKTEDFKALAKDICLHIAAANPKYLGREEVPAEALNQEREIAASQVLGKPAQVVQKIVEGKLEKYYAEHVLVEQPFVKNPDQSIKDVITAAIAKLGENIVIRRFVRFQIGA